MTYNILSDIIYNHVNMYAEEILGEYQAGSELTDQLLIICVYWDKYKNKVMNMI